MKLARKLTVALVLGIFVVMALYAGLQIRRDEAIFAEDTKADEHVMVRALGAALQTVWHLNGETPARRLLENADRSEQEVRIRFVSLEPGSADTATVPLPPDGLEKLREGHELSMVHQQADGDERRFTYLPLDIDGSHPAAIELSESLTPQRKYIRTSQVQILVATLVIVVLCGLVATGLGFVLVGRPMHQLCEQARRVGAGDLSARLALSQRDEIGELAGELNQMCDRLEEANDRVKSEIQARMKAIDQLRHADRLKTVGQLASGVAHELGTPLNVVSGRARLIETADLVPAEITTNASIIIDQAKRMTTIIRQLLDFSRRRGPKLAVANLAQITHATVDMLAPLAAKSSVSLRFDAAEERIRVRVDQNQIQQALANLVLNGVQATPSGGEVRIGVGRRRARPPLDHGGEEGEYMCVSIEDRGSGIPADQIPHIFEPFFTTKEVGQGTGLGLSVAYGIVSEHGGWIDVASEVGQGSCFLIYLAPANGTAGELSEAS
jgi:two-component system NtrC family sensor kinase